MAQYMLSLLTLVRIQLHVVYLRRMVSYHHSLLIVIAIHAGVYNLLAAFKVAITSLFVNFRKVER